MATFTNKQGSETYNIPGQNLTFKLPADGQLFRSSSASFDDGYTMRQGTKLVDLDFESMGVQAINKILAQNGLPATSNGYADLGRIDEATKNKLSSAGIPLYPWNGGYNISNGAAGWVSAMGKQEFFKQTGIDQKTLDAAPRYLSPDVSSGATRLGWTTGKSDATSFNSYVASNPQVQSPTSYTQGVNSDNPNSATITRADGQVLDPGITLDQSRANAIAANSGQNYNQTGSTTSGSQGSVRPPSVPLQPGGSGTNVQQLQQWLISQGESIPAGATGYYGDQTKSALASWQQKQGVSTNGYAGYYGPLTIAKVNNYNSVMPTPTPTGEPGAAPAQKEIGAASTGSYDSGTIDLTNPGAVFAGGTNTYLAKIKEYPNQVYLVDASTKTMHPFAAGAFDSYYGGNQEAAAAAVQEIPLKEIQPGGALSSLTMLNSGYAVNASGKYTPYTNPTSAQMSQTYGQSKVSQDELRKSWQPIDAMFNYLKSGDQTSINKEFLAKIVADPNLMTSYINAAHYGGYSMNDILRDVKRRELIASGDTSLNNVQPISATELKSTYQNTPTFQNAASNTKIAAFNDGVKGLDSSVLNLPVFQIDQSLYEDLNPALKIDTPEWNAAVSAIEAGAYDIANKSVSAQTDAEKQRADTQWGVFKDQVKKRYGIALENDALQAWQQISNLRTQGASQRGLNNSGIVNEDIDYQLRQVRRTDQQQRDNKASELNNEEYKMVTGYATPAQIKQMNDEDKAKGLAQSEWRASKYGLVPSAETTAYYDMANLKKLFPQAEESELLKSRNEILDENGNYRSTLFSQKAASIASNNEAKKTYQETKYAENQDAITQKKYKEFTKAAPFSDVNPVAGSQGTATAPLPVQTNTVQNSPQSTYSGVSGGSAVSAPATAAAAASAAKTTATQKAAANIAKKATITAPKATTPTKYTPTTVQGPSSSLKSSSVQSSGLQSIGTLNTNNSANKSTGLWGSIKGLFGY
jgi:peptidoglycan hydrolase-like protein with peptidoglycan-binding domain